MLRNPSGLVLFVGCLGRLAEARVLTTSLIISISLNGKGVFGVLIRHCTELNDEGVKLVMQKSLV